MRINPVYSYQNYSQKHKNRTNTSPSITAACKNNEVAFSGNFFTSFIRLFDSINPNVTPLERLQHLAEEAQNHHAPLGDAIYRGDFKGVIPKEKIVEILQIELKKAEFTGIKQGYHRLIEKVQKDY